MLKYLPTLSHFYVLLSDLREQWNLISARFKFCPKLLCSFLYRYTQERYKSFSSFLSFWLNSKTDWVPEALVDNQSNRRTNLNSQYVGYGVDNISYNLLAITTTAATPRHIWLWLYMHRWVYTFKKERLLLTSSCSPLLLFDFSRQS